LIIVSNPRRVPLSLSASELYRVTLVRAAAGHLPAVIDAAKAYREEHQGQAVIMRHSQGDHWDLMMLEPAAEDPLSGADFRQLADFQQHFLASSDLPWSQISKQAAAAGLFHIEMFQAAAGQLEPLLQQRHMENVYLTATQQVANAIFTTEFGSDVDCFTIGFHQDMPHFAASPDLPAEAFEQAARDAGFESRGDIGFYLRRFLVAHHDTLATRVD